MVVFLLWILMECGEYNRAICDWFEKNKNRCLRILIDELFVVILGREVFRERS